jgi:arginase
MSTKVYGIASGLGAEIYGAELGVWDLVYNLPRRLPNFYFEHIYHNSRYAHKMEAIGVLRDFFAQIQQDFAKRFDTDDRYLFITGDHANAIATWSCISNNYQQDLGLMWIDAHLDSHTPQTTPSGNVHGMPVATLMGYGDEQLTQLIHSKVKPEHVVFIGTRDYEQGEIDLLQSLGVKIYFMKDICRSNVDAIFSEATQYLTQKVAHFGVSLDIDSMDPGQMPGTGCFNPGGLLLEDVVANVSKLWHHDKLVALELTEFNPLRDINRKTMEGIVQILTQSFGEQA